MVLAQAIYTGQVVNRHELHVGIERKQRSFWYPEMPDCETVLFQSGYRLKVLIRNIHRKIEPKYGRLLEQPKLSGLGRFRLRHGRVFGGLQRCLFGGVLR